MKLYIFDLGGVCVFNFQVVGKIARMYNLNEKKLLDDYLQYDRQLMDGSITTKEWWFHIAEKFNVDKNVDPVADLFTPSVNESVVKVINEMKAQGKRIVCGSNTCEAHWSKMNAIGHFSDLFDACYLSQRMHVAKPQAAFFEYILNAENVAAQDALFIDDTEANVEGAKKCGLHGFYFHDEFAWAAVDKLQTLVL